MLVAIQRNLKLGKEMPSGRMHLPLRFQHLFWLGDLNYRIDIDRKKVQHTRFAPAMQHGNQPS